MRVLMVSKACLVGTFQRKLEEIARFPDVELTVIVPPSWKDAQGELLLERSFIAGYRLLADPILFNGQYHIHFYPRLKKRIAEFRPDILHIDEEPYNLATWHAWRLARQAGIKSLFFSWQNLNRIYPFPFNWMERSVLKGVDYAIYGSFGAAGVGKDKGYSGPAAVIPQFGVDAELFSPPARRIPGRGFMIGYAGRLVPEKGVDLLILAVADLPGLWQLSIAGDGPERENLESLAKKLGVNDRVFFEGQIQSFRMPAFMRELDAFVLPSRTRPNWKEQFGRVLIEAMACEVVVIGAACGEIPEVIGGAGLVFPENDAAALRNRLIQLMSDEEARDRLGKQGRQRVLERFTQQQIALQTVQVYREMVQ
ncbi:MAG: glycosyltransferase family 4 protein [Anaerolineales bacterium]|nr:glycosyltransferase family 4 protein [Anaerolineales bacterium]